MKQLGENPDEQEVVKMIQLVNKNGESDDDHDFSLINYFVPQYDILVLVRITEGESGIGKLG